MKHHDTKQIVCLSDQKERKKNKEGEGREENHHTERETTTSKTTDISDIVKNIPKHLLTVFLSKSNLSFQICIRMKFPLALLTIMLKP